MLSGFGFYAVAVLVTNQVAAKMMPTAKTSWSTGATSGYSRSGRFGAIYNKLKSSRELNGLLSPEEYFVTSFVIEGE
jgi:hypothetical protein